MDTGHNIIIQLVVSRAIPSHRLRLDKSQIRIGRTVQRWSLRRLIALSEAVVVLLTLNAIL